MAGIDTIEKVAQPTIEMKQLNAKKLTSGALYQRPIKTARVARIVKKFNPHKVNAIKVSFRDGRYWVFDGQHTLLALKAKYGEDCIVLCEVHYGLTYRDEARLFAEQHEDSSNVDAIYKANALAEADDSEILAMKAIAESVGLEMSFTHQKGNNRLGAISKLKSIYKTLGASGFRTTLSLIKQTWDGEPDSLASAVLGGVSLFVKAYNGEFSEETFIKNLGRIMPVEIKKKGNSDYSCKGDARFARQVWDAYNFKLRKNTRLECKV